MFGHALDFFDPRPVKFWDPYPKQAMAQALAGEVFELMFGGSAGPGKGGRTPDRTSPGYNPDTETRVLTPKGWRLFGDIKVGDTVCNPDGTTATVIRVTDNGPKQFYRVTLADGSTVEADGEHLWAVSIAGDRKRGKVAPPVIPKGLRPEDEWNLRVQTRAKVVNTVELARLVARADDEKARGLRPHYAQVPLTNPVAMTGVGTQWQTFSPYTLGALVGDGSVSVRVSICGVDPEIFDRIRAELPHGLELRQVPGTEEEGHCPAFHIARPGATDNDRDALAEFTATLRRLRAERGLGQRELASLCGSPQGTVSRIERGEVWPRPATAQRLDDALDAGGALVAAYPPRTGESAVTLLKRDGLYGLHSWEKFIPARIMRAPVPDRLAFVQGLMDTDGHIDERGYVEFVTVSERLATGMQAILRSLGYRATLNTKTTSYTHDGEKRAGRLAYRLYVQGRASADLFHMPRKRARATAGFNGGDHEPWHRVVSVVPTVVDNSRCITVDNLNHLYVTDDYIVTHNSFFLRSYACDFAVAHPGSHIALVRRTLPMLKQTHGLHLPGMLRDHARENKSEFTFTFPNASVIRFISLPNIGDEQNYKSAEFDLLLFDELTEFLESQYTFMLSRVRSARGHRAHVIATSNPEGAGFRWVKRRFVKPRPEDLAEGQETPRPGVPWSPPVVEDGKVIGWHPLRAFLPATIEDNPGLLKSNPGYVAQLRAMPDSRLRRALLDGDWDAMDDIPGALWSQSVIDDHRVTTIPDTIRMVRVVVGVDPSGSSTNGKSECGIVVAGLGSDGHFYILEDLSGPWTPTEWADKVNGAYDRWAADAVVAEVNFGGEMVAATLQAAHPLLPVTLVRASRGKAVRAEPVAVLTQRGMVHMVGRWPELEDQMCQWTPGSGWSPDRIDACFVAGTMVLTLTGERPIEAVRPGEHVWTRQGWRRVIGARLTRRAATVGTVELGDGRTLTGTPDHQVWTENRGWSRLDTLGWDDTLSGWSIPSQSSIEASSTSGTPSQISGRTASTTAHNASRDAATCTVTSGATTTPAKRSPAGGTSTTTTTTRSTTTPATSSSATPRRTPLSMLRSSLRLAAHGWSRSVRSLLRGTAPTQGESSTASSVRSCGPLRSTATTSARRADAPSRPAVLTRPGSAPAPASAGPRIMQTPTVGRSRARSAASSSGSPSTGRSPRPAGVPVARPYAEAQSPADVYDLMVEGVHEFVAQGVIVHNCVWGVAELAGGASALAFLTQLSAPCPECKTPNTTGRATCFRCGKELPHAAPTTAATVPAELRPDGPAGVPGLTPIIPAGDPDGDDVDPGDPAPDAPRPVTTAPDGTVTIAGLILPGR